MKLRTKFWLCLVLLMLAGHALAQSANRPNMVLIIADDLAWNDTGVYGNKKVGTASLATVSATRAAVAQAQDNDEPFVFSLATQKQIAFNEHFLAEISAKYAYDRTCWKNHPAYAELRAYDALAA